MERRDEVLYVGRLAAVGTAVVLTTGLRTGARHLKIAAKHGPSLARHLRTTVVGGPGAAASRNLLRDEMVTVGRELAEAAWLEGRRAVDDFDAYSREDLPASAPKRPWRVKV